MTGPLVLYVVAGVVVAALFVWVAVVLVSAPAASTLAPDVSVPARVSAPPQRSIAAKLEAPGQIRIESKPPPSGPVVVNLPPMRPRLDSHLEIQDSAGAPLVDDEGVSEGPPLVLVAAVGRTALEPGLTLEDAFVVVEPHHLFAVADAMGRNAGAVASKLGVEALSASFGADGPTPFEDDPQLTLRANRLRRALMYANHEVLERAEKVDACTGMGTAITAAYFSPTGRRAYVAAVGEAQTYRIREGAVELVADGNGSAVVGASERLDVTVTTDSPQPGDVYVLCSKRLTRSLPEGALLDCVVGATTLEGAAGKLVERARRPNTTLTAVLVRIDKPRAT